MIKGKAYYFILLVALFSTVTYFHEVAKEMVSSPFSDFGNHWLNASLLKEGLNPWSQDEKVRSEKERLVKKYELLEPSPRANSLGLTMFAQFFALSDFHLAAIF